MKNHPESVKQQIEKSLEIDLSGNLEDALTFYINHLIQNDFQKLVSLLYKIDVDEGKLKRILRENPGKDAADIIAHLIIERELQKIETRKLFKGKK